MKAVKPPTPVRVPWDLNLFTPNAERRPARKPPPERRWDEMPGKLVDQDVIRSMRPDDLHRDIWPVEKRVGLWERSHEAHLHAREHNAGYPENHGLYLVSGPMGAGKSLWMVAVAYSPWRFQAIPVFSPESAGLLFGYRISLEQMYGFSDILPQGSILVCDELAALSDNYGGGAVRSRTLSAAMTSFRKQGGLLLGASASEWSIAGALKVASEATITPKRVWPKKQIIVAYDDAWNEVYATVNLKPNEMKYPSFCYMKTTGLQVPWERRRVDEDYRRDLEKARQAQSRRARQAAGGDFDLSRWHPISVSSPTPQWAYLSSGLYDTFSRVPISDQYHIDADRMRASSLEGQRLALGSGEPDLAAQVLDFLRWSVSTTLYDEHFRKGSIPWEKLHEGAEFWKPEIFKRMPMAQFQRGVKAVLPEGCTKRLIGIEAILDKVGRVP